MTAKLDLSLDALDAAALPTAELLSQAAPVSPNAKRPTQHILTIQLEDWFQVRAFQKLIDREQWYRFDTRLEKNTATTLDLLDRHHTKATFFVLGWVATRLPDVVKEIVRRGHEVACSDFSHRSIRDLTPQQFREDVLLSRDAVESAAGQRVLGFRVGDGWFKPTDLWALDILAELGFAYDSSVLPMFRTFASEPFRRQVHRHESPTGSLFEVPPSTTQLLGLSVPIAGGNWFRQLPQGFIERHIADWTKTAAAPFVMYFHTWELDSEPPQISAIDRVGRIRHYRNLDRLKAIVEHSLSSYRFGTVAESLGLKTGPRAEGLGLRAKTGTPTSISVTTSSSSALGPRRSALGQLPVTIVIPCFNEEDSLPYLARTLERVESELLAVGSEVSDPKSEISNPRSPLAPSPSPLARPLAPTFLFVDDRSTDRTWDVMHAVFGSKTNCRFVRHENNSGVSAAILTGIKHSDTEIVCSMDCDCSYDPVELKRMIPLLTEGVDLVTASPYHPKGRVKNVPGWRLLLSKGLSLLYRIVLPIRLHTWTSCFRVYRKSVIEQLPLVENGFLGTAELVAHLALRGRRIVEHPATLEVRIFGDSKMKTCRTIRGHLRLIARFVQMRLTGNVDPPPASASSKALSEISDLKSQIPSH